MIRNAKFVISCAELKQLPDFKLEIAVSGKSNVGKSSFINAMTGNGKLARTSKEPGRTRLLNYFDCNNGQFALVDLPGYGYAKVSDDEKRKWAYLIEAYFATGRVKHLVQLLDCRHDPTREDVMMINYLYHYNIPFTLVATKSDKLSKMEKSRRKQEIATFLKVGADNVYLFSSDTKEGKDALDERLKNVISFYENYVPQDADGCEEGFPSYTTPDNL